MFMLDTSNSAVHLTSRAFVPPFGLMITLSGKSFCGSFGSFSFGARKCNQTGTTCSNRGGHYHCDRTGLTGDAAGSAVMQMNKLFFTSDCRSQSGKKIFKTDFPTVLKVFEKVLK